MNGLTGSVVDVFSGTSGNAQAFLLPIPVAATPVALAYAARYAFESEAAYFIVLAIAAGVGAVGLSVVQGPAAG